MELVWRFGEVSGDGRVERALGFHFSSNFFQLVGLRRAFGHLPSAKESRGWDKGPSPQIKIFKCIELWLAMGEEYLVQNL